MQPYQIAPLGESKISHIKSLKQTRKTLGTWLCLCLTKNSTSEGSKGITHYPGDKNRFDVSSKGPSSGISVGGRGKHACFYISEYIKTTRDKIKTNQMDCCQ